jgi:DNA-binding beta-propeller fold protein YncE
VSLLTLVLAGCVESAPLPDVGACAVYPDGIYEFGQLGVGTCLAGPSALQFLDNGAVLAITNANPFLDFTGGSLLSLDLNLLDEGLGRNLVTDLAPSAVGLPSFAGATAYAEPYAMLLVTGRLSDGARTREATDVVRFVNVANPRLPSLLDDVGPEEGGSALSVGYDPVEVVYDAESDRAWTVNRTSHTVSTLDLASRPARLVPPGGDGRLVGNAFEDVDGSGSRASFVHLDTIDSTVVEPDAWSLRWSSGAVRAWAATDAGLYRVTGNGERTWVRSGVPYDVNLAEESEGATVHAPTAVTSYDSVISAQLAFVDQGEIVVAGDPEGADTTEDVPGPFAYGTAILSPEGDELELGDPWLFAADGTWHLFYSAGEGNRWVGLATSADGVSFKRRGVALSSDAGSISDLTVLWDPEQARWRAWYSVTPEGGAPELHTAWSDGLDSWTEESPVVAGLPSPSIGYWSGRFHAYTADATEGAFREWLSTDGYTWEDAGISLVPEAGVNLADGLALQVTNESAFRLEDAAGRLFSEPLSAGVLASQSDQGWRLSVAVGHLLGPDEVASFGSDGVAVTSWLGDDVWADVYDGATRRIAHGGWVDEELALDDEVALDVGSAGSFDAEGVHDAVVVQSGAEWLMFYAGDAGAITSIGRATSTDGVTWSRGGSAVYTASEDWEVGVAVPGSVQVLADGSLRLWYSTAAPDSDGEDARIAALDSTDGGKTWELVAGDTYLWQFDADAPGTWNDSGVKDPFVVSDGDVERMWFSGFDGDVWQLGYAERKSGATVWRAASDSEGTPRPILLSATGSLGAAGVSRPIVQTEAEGFRVLYAGWDATSARVGLATGLEPDRLNRSLDYPTLADTWGFTVVPPNDADAISLDADLAPALSQLGCMTLAFDDRAGMLYVGCKLAPYIYVLDVRDDSTASWADLNYLGVEAILSLGLNGASGARDLVVNPEAGTLYALADEPEAVLVIRADDLVDDQVTDLYYDRILGTLALPRSYERDRGVGTQAAVGPAQMALHPDGQHLFVSNFNDNSVSVFDLTLGPLGTLVAQAEGIGENPYSLVISPDGTRAVVANYSGEVEDYVSSTLVVLDADPASDTFAQPITWIVNR